MNRCTCRGTASSEHLLLLDEKMDEGNIFVQHFNRRRDIKLGC